MAFDPYSSWLGIPFDRRPPTHYDLLGLDPSESDISTIEQAALRRMSRVRQYHIGPHSDLSQETLAELARARLVLMDPVRRADYDAKLLARSEKALRQPVSLASARNGKMTEPQPRPVEVAAYSLDSLVAVSAGDGSLGLRSAPRERSLSWPKRLFQVAIVASHAALFWAFFAFGPSIAKWWAGRSGDPLATRPPIVMKPAPPSNSMPPKVRISRSPVPRTKTTTPVPPVTPPVVAAPAARDVPPEWQAERTNTVAEQRPESGASQGGDVEPDRGMLTNHVNARSPEQRLANRGLRREKGRYVLVQETEVRQKLGEAQTSFDSFALAFDRRVQIERDRATVRGLEQRIPMLQKAVGDHNALLGKLPRGSNVEKDQFAAVENERDILEAQLREAREQHDVIASQLPPDQEIRELEGVVASRRRTCESKVETVRGLINSTKKKYAELRKDEGLKADLGKSMLGPLPDLRKLDLQTKEIERRLAVGAAMMGATR